MPARELTPRVSIAQVRGQLTPRAYRAMTSVRLEHGGVACDGEAAHRAGQRFHPRGKPWMSWLTT